MRRLANALQSVALASGVTALPAPPVSCALVPPSWTVSNNAVLAEFELEIVSESSVSLTEVMLVGAIPMPYTAAASHPTVSRAVLALSGHTTNNNAVLQATAIGAAGNAVTIAAVADAGAKAGSITDIAKVVTIHFDDGVSTVGDVNALFPVADASVQAVGTVAHVLHVTVDEFTAQHLAGGVDNAFALTGHGYLTGDGPFLLTAGTTNPGGTDPAQLVWTIAIDANTLALATSQANALAGTRIPVTDAGVGTITLTAQASATRLYWCMRALLGVAGDGAITLDGPTAGYTFRANHSPRVVAYALVGSLGDTVALHVGIAPIDEL